MRVAVNSEKEKYKKRKKEAGKDLMLMHFAMARLQLRSQIIFKYFDSHG